MAFRSGDGQGCQWNPDKNRCLGGRRSRSYISAQDAATATIIDMHLAHIAADSTLDPYDDSGSKAVGPGNRRMAQFPYEADVFYHRFEGSLLADSCP